MGLDITAYESVTLVRAGRVYVEELDDGKHVHLWKGPSFDRGDGLVEGYYRFSGEVFGFCAGSYGGYNEWRSDLARLVGTTDHAIWNAPDPTGPFVELINFADNEGIIGATTSRKLADDFDAWLASNGSVDRIGRFWNRFADWQRAFRIAARGGVVKFH